jgi:glycosyltransferase involved in cell wall biosynthesis
MEYEIAFSIVMAAYNSENTIGLALQSIREQVFDQKLIEILVIDGGSEDNTRNIALQYGAKVIDNPQKLPEPAKIIGLKAAQGKYVQIMDSDEVISNDHILSMRYSVLEKYDSLKVLTGGYQNPVYTDMMQTGMSDMGACSEYINKVGDPFTCFVYGTYKGGSMPGLTIRRGMYDADLKC